MRVRRILAAACMAAALLGGCSPVVEVADVCSELDEASCGEPCSYERGTETCLQLCRDGAECPDDFVCEQGDRIDHCPPGGGCLGYALTDDVCRPE